MLILHIGWSSKKIGTHGCVCFYLSRKRKITAFYCLRNRPGASWEVDCSWNDSLCRKLKANAQNMTVRGRSGVWKRTTRLVLSFFSTSKNTFAQVARFPYPTLPSATYPVSACFAHRGRFFDNMACGYRFCVVLSGARRVSNATERGFGSVRGAFRLFYWATLSLGAEISSCSAGGTGVP